MSHEILEHDNVILHRQPAWHGLGVVVEDAPTPLEALEKAGLDWEVEQWHMVAHNDKGSSQPISTHVQNVRADTATQLGIVSTSYKPLQNRELAEFCEALAEGGDEVRVESAGSIRNGAKVWFLLKGNSFGVRDDELIPYFCISNGFDGFSSVRGTPTTVRVVCSNTLHMVIPDYREGVITGVRQAGFSFRHLGDIKKRVDEAKSALKLYNHGLEQTKKVLDAVAAKEIKEREDLQKFFAQCYAADFGAIPLEPKNDKENNAKWKAMLAYRKIEEKFEKEVKIVGPNLWAAVNAYTGWVQNDRETRIKNPALKVESRMNSKLFGTDANRAHHALQVAIAT